MAATDSPTGPETERLAELALGGWVALLLAALRSGLALALELGHHGDLELAWLRLAQGFRPISAEALALGLSAGFLVHATRARGVARRALALVFAALAALYLAGSLDPDPSRHLGLDTPRGVSVTLLVCALALSVFAGVFLTRLARLRAFLGAHPYSGLPPVALLAAAGLFLRTTQRELDAGMHACTVLSELGSETWEVLQARADCPPAPGVICPVADPSAAGAARPALVLAPPARVRLRLSSAVPRATLITGAGVDASVGEDVGERYAGHRVRFRMSLDGVPAFQAERALEGEPSWAEAGGSGGLEVRAGAELELETALLDASGAEVVPADPLRAGFGALQLQRRAQRARVRATSERPNIVLFLVDTLRADRTSAYGYARETTPNLAALAARGVLFEEALATASWTWPSTASILSGLQPQQHGVQDAASSFLPGRVDTLAEALQRAGFTTAGYSGSPLIVPDKNFDQGFEFFDASREGNLRRSELVLPPALEWLGGAREWRFFLYLHLMDTHAPYVPRAEGRERFASEVPPSFDPRKTIDYSWDLLRDGFSTTGERRTDAIVPPEEQRWISDLYDGCAWSADWWLGRLLARLDELGLRENTLVVVTSDHGEELFDHGLMSHAHGLHRELVRVPLVLSGPGIARGARVAGALTCASIGPTLARLGGAELANPELAADLFAAEHDEDVFFSTRQGWWHGKSGLALYGLRRGSHVLVFAPEGRPWGAKRGQGEDGGEISLHDLATDPGELHDLAADEPETARRLKDELARRLAEFEAAPSAAAEVDRATLEMLRGLGYGGR